MRGRVVAFVVLSAVAQPVFSIAQEPSAGKKLYLTYCTGCHGASGKGDGPAGKTLTVKPADHTDAKKMGQYSDDHLFTVIAKGGAMVGRSVQMPAWGAVLKDSQIRELVDYIKTLAATPRDAQAPTLK